MVNPRAIKKPPRGRLLEGLERLGLRFGDGQDRMRGLDLVELALQDFAAPVLERFTAGRNAGAEIRDRLQGCVGGPIERPVLIPKLIAGPALAAPEWLVLGDGDGVAERRGEGDDVWNGLATGIRETRDNLLLPRLQGRRFAGAWIRKAQRFFPLLKQREGGCRKRIHQQRQAAIPTAPVGRGECTKYLRLQPIEIARPYLARRHQCLQGTLIVGIEKDGRRHVT